MLKRFLALLLALLFCISFAACDGNPPDVTPEDSTSDIASDTTVPTREAIAVDIVKNGNSGYKVIRSETASEEVKTAVAAFYKKITTELEAKDVKIDTDWHRRDVEIPATAKEIVIGYCERPDSDDIYAKLRRNDFSITYKGERVFIMGGSDEATIRALDYFCAHYIDKAEKSITVSDNLDYTDLYTYPLGLVSVNGVDIRDYKIVTPGGDLLAKMAAQNLSDYFYYNGGIKLETISDSEETTEYELLVGATNRPESSKATSVTLADDQYVLAVSGSKIVMYGKDYMVGGAVSDFINHYAVSTEKNKPVDVTTLPTAFSAKTFTFEKAESAILLICDGMGYNHVRATLDSGKILRFVPEMLPNKGSAQTYSYSVKIGSSGYTDSAAAGTALATGYKTVNGYLGLNYRGATIQNIRELAASKGAKTAILSTDYITGATPSAFLVHINDRNNTEGIQTQIDKLTADGGVDYAISNKDSDNIINDIPAALWGIASDGSQFFSMIEEADCDKQSHKYDLNAVINRVNRYNNIVAYCVEFVLCHPKSLLVATADHETGGVTYNEKTQKYEFTTYNSAKTKTNHSNADVPVYAIGYGTEKFNNTTVNNIDIPKFMAKLYGSENFGE